MKNKIKEDMLKIITFEESAKKEILSIFGKTTDEEGFIIEKDTGQRVITSNGEEIRLEEFAGIRKGDVKGSEIFIKSDLPSVVEIVDELE